MKKFVAIAGILILLAINNFAQDTTIVDKIVARVGDKIVLLSDIESQYLEYLASGKSASKKAKCKIFEDALIEKVLLNQADIDSIVVTDDELENEIDARLQIYIEQLGGVAALENYLNKSIFDIKKDLKEVLRNQIRAQKVQNKILENVDITPSEVRDYYDNLPKDSLPWVDAQIEIQQIVVYPKMTKEEEAYTLKKINDIREQIVSGKKKFEAMARFYSEDEESAKKGGEIGYHNRSELDPTFASVAFSLDSGEVSDVVKTKFGYHIIQLIDRKGERVNVRHILIKPVIPPSAIKKAERYLDSVRQLILDDSLTFEEAAERFSEDENTKNNGGLLFNPMTGESKFNMNELPTIMKFDIKDLKVGEISKPIKTYDEYGNVVIKLYKIKSKTPPHKANLSDDYQLIMNMALKDKKDKIYNDWLRKQIKELYISIDDDFKNCDFKFNWLKK